VLRHHAYLSRLTKPKLRWAARLLKLELKDRPGQLHYLIELGDTLLRLDDPQGHEVMAEAAGHLTALAGLEQPPIPTVQRLLEYLITVPPEHSRGAVSRQEARDLAVRWFPRTPPLLWQNAAVYFQEEKFAEAAEQLERLVECGLSGVYDRSEGFDPAILGDSAWANLGACYTRLRQLDRAEHCFRRLLNSPTHAAQAKQNLAVVQNLRLQKAGRNDAFWEQAGYE
jgi:tetratricopeptide (TPR) repeat protein